MNKVKKELFENMPVSKAIAVLATPTIISQLINLIYNIVDTYFIGRTGNSYMIAAVTLVFPLFMMNIAFANLFGIGGGGLVARLIGKCKDTDAKKVSAFSFYSALAVASLYSFIIALFLNPILNLLGASSVTIEYAQQYVWFAIIFGGMPTILSSTGAHLLRNVGYSKQASIGLSGGGILNMVLDPIFMFVLLPEGKEVLGAALATMLSNVVSCGYILIMLIKVSRSAAISVNPVSIKGIQKENIILVFSVGVPSAVLALLYDVANIVLNALMALHGDLALAAIGIVMKAERLPTVINIGICQGMLPIVAYNYSSGNHKRMRKTISTVRIYGMVIAFFSIALFELFATPITQVFLSTSTENVSNAVNTITLAAIFLRIRCLVSPMQFLNYHTSYCMQSMGDGRGTLLHAAARELVFYIPLMLMMNHFWGIYALAGALVVSESCGAIFAIYLLRIWMEKLNCNTRV